MSSVVLKLIVLGLAVVAAFATLVYQVNFLRSRRPRGWSLGFSWGLICACGAVLLLCPILVIVVMVAGSLEHF